MRASFLLRNSIYFIGILVASLYVLAGASQFDTLLLITRGDVEFSTTLTLLFSLPYLVVRYTEPVLAISFLLSAILGSTYFFLLLQRIATGKMRRLAYGLSGSLLSVVSIGCIACGALLSPLALIAAAGIPLALFSNINVAFAILSNVLLAAGVAILYRDMKS